MTIPQKTAFAFPCLFGFETAQRRYGWVLARERATLVLTVNTGYE